MVPEDCFDVPPLFAQRVLIDNNPVRQLVLPATSANLVPDDRGWAARLTDDVVFPIYRRAQTPVGTTALEVDDDAFSGLPVAPPFESLRWVTSQRPGEPDEVLDALRGRFVLRTEDPHEGLAGLRIPQAGAVHAVLAHWSTGATDAATVVLPTGTGKTETMIALFASERLPRVLVLVPTDNLRTQIGNVFESYGVLRHVGVLEPGTRHPVVGRIAHHFESVAGVRTFADRCNVVLTTPSALNASSDSIIDALVGRCTHLFVDEAHHVRAASWSSIRDRFSGKPVVQFTATPYRADGNPLGGRMIYSFPLGRAQQLGYFEKINYISIVALADPDRAVAKEAIGRLRDDQARGFDHLIMARVSRIGRARDEILPLYEELAPELNPRLLHSDLKASERAKAIRDIRERESRVVVCVDMLGEGFDFPELKIAALHDPHRSLGVALQFIGRFARTRRDLGSATAVVARPEPGYDTRLRALYAERNQWDAVIENLSAQAIDEVRELDEFEAGFAERGEDELSLHALRPKMSAVVYSTDCQDWQPERLSEVLPSDEVISAPSVNARERVVWAVVEHRVPVRWGQLRSIENVLHHLHLLHWDRERALLYIYSSELESLHENLARAVCGESVVRISGDSVYRVMADLDRAVPTNVGLLDVRNNRRRFSMYVGADVYEGFPVAEQQTRTNTNIFVVGFAKGERVTLGASLKGRIWSHQSAASILEWVQWCREVGPKLQDETVDLDAILRRFVRPRQLEARPSLAPIGMDWPWIAYSGMTDVTRLELGDTEALIIDVELAIVDHADKGAIRYEVRAGGFVANYEAVVHGGQLVHRSLDGEARVLRDKSDPEPLSAYLNREGVTIWFEDEVLIEGPGLLLELERDPTPIDLENLIEVDWSGVDLKRESQGPARDATTIQARAAERLIGLRDWDVVVDDDGTGEIADLVAVKDLDDRLLVHLVHCKYSAETVPGARVGDLYEVCGQAHRSAHLRHAIGAMIKNLIRRERARRKRGYNGVLVGTDEALLGLQDLARLRRPQMQVTIAQPGLSKAAAQTRHLQLLGAADVYLREIAFASFDVWCSA